jgi:succinylglutamic semialdehyde dehydrogenase
MTSSADLIARETGKPLWEARSRGRKVINKVEISIRAYAERTSQRKLDNAMQGTALRHKPHGVMAVIGPYNFPAHLPNGHIVPALIAGNSVVFKPSEKTPPRANAGAMLLHRAGISARACSLLIGGPAEEGQALARMTGIDGVLFTGSAHTGIAINRKLAARPDKIVALEMGGNNPMVVWDTPKVTDAAALVVQSAFTTRGSAAPPRGG